MAVFRLTKAFSFEMAHALVGYDGPCSAIHGHSYRLFVTVKGSPEGDEQSPKQGMVIDFGVLKQIVNEEVVNRLDHALVLSKKCDEQLREALKERYRNLVEVEYQPTSENLLEEFARRIISRLPQGVMLYSLRLHETATSYAEWFADDNP